MHEHNSPAESVLLHSAIGCNALRRHDTLARPPCPIPNTYFPLSFLHLLGFYFQFFFSHFHASLDVIARRDQIRHAIRIRWLRKQQPTEDSFGTAYIRDSLLLFLNGEA